MTRQQQKVFITVLFSMNKYYFHHFKKGKERREMTEPSSLFAYVIVFPPTEYWGLWSATSHFLPNLLLSWFHLHLLVRTKESVIGGASGMIEGRVGVRVGGPPSLVFCGYWEGCFYWRRLLRHTFNLPCLGGWGISCQWRLEPK